MKLDKKSDASPVVVYPNDLIPTRTRPLISFCLLAYNQEHYIRAAVEAALSQTYSPLEIILSDDCSPDRTFEIMLEMATSYSGPHKIKLTKNERNLGLIRHVNRIVTSAQGELIVFAAGDDISVPERTQKLVDFWIARGKPMAVLYSQARRITLSGSLIDEKEPFMRELQGGLRHIALENKIILGASEAFSKDLVNFFGPLREDLYGEDQSYTLRGAIVENLLFLKEPLLYWRQGSGISTSGFNEPKTRQDQLNRLKKVAKQRILVSEQMYADACKWNSKDTKLIRIARLNIAVANYIDAVMNKGFSDVMFAGIKLLFHRPPLKELVRWIYHRFTLCVLNCSSSAKKLVLRS